MDKEMMNQTEEVTVTADELRIPRGLAEYIVRILDSKKARDIKLLHVEKQTVITDYFVICTGNSRTQIRALADEIEFKLSAFDITPTHTEGADTGTWLLQDYDSVIVHIFNSEARDFYNLDKLYAETKEQDISDLLTED